MRVEVLRTEFYASLAPQSRDVPVVVIVKWRRRHFRRVLPLPALQ